MSFYDTPARRLAFVRACGCFVLCAAIGAFPFVFDVDSYGRILTLGLAGFCLLMGVFYLWQARRTSPDESVTLFPDRTPVPEQVQYFRRVLWLTVAAFPVATAMVVYELNRLESGAVKSVSVWYPIAMIYNFLGYWPAVLALPALGVTCIVVFLRRLRRLDARECEPGKG